MPLPLYATGQPCGVSRCSYISSHRLANPGPSAGGKFRARTGCEEPENAINPIAIPAKAGTQSELVLLGPRFRGDDNVIVKPQYLTVTIENPC